MALINYPERNRENSERPRYGSSGLSSPLGAFLGTDAGFEARFLGDE